MDEHADSAARMPILMYHSLDNSGSVISMAPAVFAEQMTSLADIGYRGITLREAVAHRNAHGHWPRRGVPITFDDGFVNVCDVALPVLQRFGFSASVFVVSGHVGGWNDWDIPPVGLGAQRVLSASQVRELAAAGIEIGAHTRSHLDLRRLEPHRITEEIIGSRDDLAAMVGAPIESFAYPFGYLSTTAITVASRAFRTACTTLLQRAGDAALHQLPRVDMYYIRSGAALARLVTGQLDRYLAIRRWGRRVREVLPR